MKNNNSETKSNYEFAGKDIIITYDLKRCTHVSECLIGLPNVFSEIRHPNVLPDLESADKIAEVISRCPSGALQFKRIDGGPQESIPKENEIKIIFHGPYNVRGDIELVDPKGNLIFKDTRVSLCRCGKSKNLPFCDGNHLDALFLDAGTVLEKNISDVSKGKLRITVYPKGPYALSGPFILKDSDNDIRLQSEKAVLCGCGSSKKRPFCDGRHVKSGVLTQVKKRV